MTTDHPNRLLPLRSDERYAVFIDGANLYQTAKLLGFDIDYKRLRALFRSNGQLLRIYYYTALLDEQEYSPVRPLVDWLDYNGYTLVTKPLKEYSSVAGRRKFKGNMDVEIVVDVMEVARTVDHIILCSGDGDFRKLLEAVGRMGCRTSVISSLQSGPPMVADELRRQADFFIDLQDLESEIARAGSPPRQAVDDDDDDDDDYEYEDEDEDEEDEARVP
ncbi:MAG: NYN domain-containing protein [Pseudomonadota bacterium]